MYFVKRRKKEGKLGRGNREIMAENFPAMKKE